MSSESGHEYYLPPDLNIDELLADPSFNYDMNAMTQTWGQLDSSNDGHVEPDQPPSLRGFSWVNFNGSVDNLDDFDFGVPPASEERDVNVSQENNTAVEESLSATPYTTQLSLPNFTSPVQIDWKDLGILLHSSPSTHLPRPPSSSNYTSSYVESMPNHFFVPNTHRGTGSSLEALEPLDNPAGSFARMYTVGPSHSAPPSLLQSRLTSRDASPSGPATPADERSDEPPRVALGDATNRDISASRRAPSPKAPESFDQSFPIILSTPSSIASSSAPRPSKSELPRQQDADTLPPAPAPASADPLPPAPADASSTRRRRRITKRSVVRPPIATRERSNTKFFVMDVRESARRGGTFRVKSETVTDVSCCELVGDAGYCKFKMMKDGAEVVCNQELPKNDKVVRSHFAIHLEELGYYERESREGNFEAACPWCGEKPTLFGGLLRHILYTELKINSFLCECGGTNSRNNQRGNKGRHEGSERHQAFLRRKAEEAKAAWEQETEAEERVLEASILSEAKGKVVEEPQELKLVEGPKRVRPAVEERAEFVQGSSRDIKRRRSL